MKLLFLALAALAALALMTGCEEEPVTYAPPELICTAPDGTKLWRVGVRNTGEVFFSSQGASWQTTQDQGDGNVSIVKHHTPNAKR